MSKLSSEELTKKESKLPVINECKVVAQSRLFRIEQLDLTFANGEEVVYERLKGSSRGGVLVVALQDDDTVLMVREYGVGVEGYELMFPKGRIENDEPIEIAANRELQEEVGFAAKKLTLIKSMTLAPGYMGHLTHLVLAEDLYPATLEGDEPEPLEVVSWKMDKLHELSMREDVTEARTIAAAYIIKSVLDQRPQSEA
ncbi:MAG: ADP compounds hydrolase NudE [Gammaproteobacteria bacterium]|nr:ADP compounds hydrolase NudE [Gammaproteobacteria bacterium]